MTFKPRLCTLASAVLLACAAPVMGQTNSQIEELKRELERLRQEVGELKRAQPSSPAAAPATENVNTRLEQVELRQKDSVTAGDVPGSFRLPGSNTSVRIYGYAEANLIHDLRGTAPGDNFTNLQEQPLGALSSGAKGKTKLTGETSRFGFETSTPTSTGAFNTKLEMDFYAYVGGENNRGRLRLRHAYGEYAGWLIGQTWSTFMDDNTPETIDFSGPIGTPFSRRTQVRYTYKSPDLGALAFALEDPENGGSMPNLVAKLDHNFDWGGVTLRALGHQKRVVGVKKNGYGFGLGANYKLGSSTKLLAQYNEVNGDYDYLFGANGYSVNDDGSLTFDKNRGMVFGIAHVFNERLRSNFSFSANKGKTATTFDNKSLQLMHVNVIYSPITNVELGAEYIYGERKTFSDESGKLSRLNLLARYSF
jgi:hypothetical protein